MGAMTVSTGLPFGRPLTVDDLEAMPDDGHRYELLDGTLLVTPGPAWEHQEVGTSLLVVLRNARPPEFTVLPAPFAVTFGLADTELQPDVFVARYSDMRHRNLPAAPVLAVEVLSPSTSLVDRNLKKAAYERFGVESYWIVDPINRTLHAFELRDGSYHQVADLQRDDIHDFERPFPVRVSMPALWEELDRDPS
jgi:Uma2 family endonuclease